jgi:hypothetical protein
MTVTRLGVRLSLHPRHVAELKQVTELLCARTGERDRSIAGRLVELAAVQRGLASLRLELEQGGTSGRAA